MKFVFISLFLFSFSSAAQPTQSDLGESLTKREFFTLLDQNAVIADYLQNNEQPVAAVIAIVQLLNQHRVRGAYEAVATLLEQLADTIEKNPEEFSKKTVLFRLRIPLTTLLERFTYGRQHEAVLRIFDRLWLWGPQQLPLLNSKIRNNLMSNYTTQILWAFKKANKTQRKAFIQEVANDALVDWRYRWFGMAIAMMNGHEYSPTEQIKLMRSISMTNPQNLLPPPRPKTYRGEELMTSLDLYNLTVYRLRMRALANEEGLRSVRQLARDFAADPRIHLDTNSQLFRGFMDDLFDPTKSSINADVCRWALD